MKVYYDKKNDVVTIYLEEEDWPSKVEGRSSREIKRNRAYEVEEAAGLLLDMVDLIGENGDLKGFRVFNASKYYDLELLNSADIEELSSKELSIRPIEKVIKRIR